MIADPIALLFLMAAKTTASPLQLLKEHQNLVCAARGPIVYQELLSLQLNVP